MMLSHIVTMIMAHNTGDCMSHAVTSIIGISISSKATCKGDQYFHLCVLYRVHEYSTSSFIIVETTAEKGGPDR